MTALTISRVHFPVTTLGPGRRIGIWFQGCSIRCPGCISADTWSARPPNATVSQVLSLCDGYGDDAEGVTVSGGEPFEQLDALEELLAGLRDRLKPSIDILVYSGKPSHEVLAICERWPGLIDALISEPYLADAPQTKPLLGSDNQKLHLLTLVGGHRYKPYQRKRSKDDDRVDIAFDGAGTVWMAGIPRRGTLEQLKVLLSAQGTTIYTSEQIPR